MADKSQLYSIARELRLYLQWQAQTGAAGVVPASAPEREAWEERIRVLERARLERLRASFGQSDTAGAAAPQQGARPVPNVARPTAAAAEPQAADEFRMPGSTTLEVPEAAAVEAPPMSGPNALWKQLGSRQRRTFEQVAEPATRGPATSEPATRAPERRPQPERPSSERGPQPERRSAAAAAKPSDARRGSSNPAPSMPDPSMPAYMLEDPGPGPDYPDYMVPVDSDMPEYLVSEPEPMGARGSGTRDAPRRSAVRKPMTAAEKLDFLKNYLGDCRRCGLCRERTNIVFGVGSPEAKLMFIGEGPGYYEDRQGEPFVGESGQLLDRMIEAMGLSRAEVYITNVVKCRPPKNRNPSPDEIRECAPFLIKQIEAVGPTAIVTLGTFATQTLLQSDQSLAQLRGRWHDWRDMSVMPTYHPAYLLRNAGAKRPAWEDLQKVMAKLGLSG